MDFKIIFPAGYQIKDVSNSNIDINIILKSGDVYWGTLFTIENIQHLLNKDGDPCFWATDMLIVKDLTEKTIREAIDRMIKDDFFAKAFSKTGDILKQYPGMSFDEIPDMAIGYNLNSKLDNI